MPNKRAADQTTIAFSMDRELWSKVNEARKREDGEKSVSQFVRDAIGEELRRMGYDIPRSLTQQRDRVRVNRYPAPRSGGLELNEKAASLKAVSPGKGVLKKAVSGVEKGSASK